MFCKELSQLPAKIQSVILDITPPKDFYSGIKTLYKPNSTIPYLWIVATASQLLLCNTHQTRGLYKSYSWSEISDIQYKLDGLGNILVKIIFTNVDEPDLLLPLNDKTSQDDVKVFLSVIPK